MIGYDPTSPKPFGDAPIIQSPIAQSAPPLDPTPELLELQAGTEAALREAGVLPELPQPQPEGLPWLLAPGLFGLPRWQVYAGAAGLAWLVARSLR